MHTFYFIQKIKHRLIHNDKYVLQLVQQPPLSPEIRDSNTVIGKFYLQSTGLKRHRGQEWPRLGETLIHVYTTLKIGMGTFTGRKSLLHRWNQTRIRRTS